MLITFPQRRFTLSWQAHHLGLVWADRRWVSGFVRAVFISQLPYPSSQGRTLLGLNWKFIEYVPSFLEGSELQGLVFLAPANHLDYNDSFSLRSCLLVVFLGFSSWTVPAFLGIGQSLRKMQVERGYTSLECCLLRSFQFDTLDFLIFLPSPVRLLQHWIIYLFSTPQQIPWGKA